jgi:hypothetical protein
MPSFSSTGRRFQVTKPGDKTCDTVTGRYVGRRMENTVHLEHRCDGRAYGGCQAGCLIFWKEAWLKPIGKETAPGADADVHLTNRADACTEDHVVRQHAFTSRREGAVLLPGYSSARIYQSAQVVGRQAVCAGLPLGQCLPQ